MRSKWKVAGMYSRSVACWCGLVLRLRYESRQQRLILGGGAMQHLPPHRVEAWGLHSYEQQLPEFRWIPWSSDWA